MPNFWTVTEDYALTKRWNAGESVNQIADFLGRSRSAVTGRVKRLAGVGKLTPRKSPLPEAYVESMRKPEPKGVTLVNLKHTQCHNVISDNLYCGLPAFKKQYCAECYKKIYQK